MSLVQGCYVVYVYSIGLPFHWSFVLYFYFQFHMRLLPFKVGADIANICNEAAIYAARRRTKRGIEQRVRIVKSNYAIPNTRYAQYSISDRESGEERQREKGEGI